MKGKHPLDPVPAINKAAGRFKIPEGVAWFNQSVVHIHDGFGWGRCLDKSTTAIGVWRNGLAARGKRHIGEVDNG